MDESKLLQNRPMSILIMNDTVNGAGFERTILRIEGELQYRIENQRHCSSKKQRVVKESMDHEPDRPNHRPNPSFNEELAFQI